MLFDLVRFARFTFSRPNARHNERRLLCAGWKDGVWRGAWCLKARLADGDRTDPRGQIEPKQ